MVDTHHRKVDGFGKCNCLIHTSGYDSTTGVCNIPAGFAYDAANDRVDCDANYYNTGGTLGVDSATTCVICDDGSNHKKRGGSYPSWTCGCDTDAGYYDDGTGTGTCVYKPCELTGQQAGESECWKVSGVLPTGCKYEDVSPYICTCDTSAKFEPTSAANDNNCQC